MSLNFKGKVDKYGRFSGRLTTKITGKSMTIQSDRKMSENIVERYRRTGKLPEGIEKAAQYIDCTKIPDLRACQEKIIKAEAAFGSLPIEVRKRFGNDPAEFLDFVRNPESQDEMVRLGLLKPKPVPKSAEPKAPAAKGEAPPVAEKIKPSK